MVHNSKAIFRVARPPYVFQPLQILKRLRLKYFWKDKKDAIVRLPWGLNITVNPNEAIGSNIAGQGIYESAVTESLWRLTDPGDLAVDVGANFGYSASILGVRVGQGGCVLCFEPHPELFVSLQRNVESWTRSDRCGFFDLRQVALGEETGKAFLHTNDWFRTNRGTAWISLDEIGGPDEMIRQVCLQTLDSILSTETVGIAKIDVEGSVLRVLQGMNNLLSQHRVRDIVFEEEAAFPAATHILLKAHGYSILGLEERFTGVAILPDASPHFDREIGPTPNYLATVDVERATRRLTPSVWRSFGPAGRVLGDLR
jgi:FkbM family methyltransferase